MICLLAEQKQKNKDLLKNLINIVQTLPFVKKVMYSMGKANSDLLVFIREKIMSDLNKNYRKLSFPQGGLSKLLFGVISQK